MSLPLILFAALSSLAPADETEIRNGIPSGDVAAPFHATALTACASPATIDETPAVTAPAAPMEATLAPEDEIVVTARRRNNTGDPLHVINQQSFAAAQELDNAFIGPVAVAYADNVPRPVRTGVRNFLKNLREPIVLVNFIAQLKPVSAAKTAGRFAVNSTVGVAGLVDVAKRRPFNLPERRNGFANTMGYYGVKTGPYFFLPLFGPTTLRDAIGAVADGSMLIAAIGAPFNQPGYTLPTSGLGAVDRRIAFDEDLQRIREDSADAYGARRTLYLCRRQAEIDALHRPTGPTLQFGTRNADKPGSLNCDSVPALTTAEADEPFTRAAEQRADAGASSPVASIGIADHPEA